MTTEHRDGYIFSRFFHKQVREDEVVVFNSLTPNPAVKVGVLGWEEFINNPQKYRNSTLFNSLIELNLLIPSQESDNKQLEDARGRFKDGLSGFPKTLYLVLTENCNLACDYCPFSRSKDLNEIHQSMSVDIAQKGLDFFSRSIDSFPLSAPTNCNIIFYGGEPLLNIKVLTSSLEYIDILRSKKRLPRDTRLLLDTNGVLLTSQVAGLLKKHEVQVTVALDAFSTINDIHRQYSGGQGTYEKVLESLKILNEINIPTYLSMSVTPDNLRVLDSFAKHLKQNNILGVGVNILRGIDTDEDYERKSAGVLEKLFWHFQEEGIIEFQTTRKFQAFTFKVFHVSNCGGFGEHVVIHPDGEIGNCPWTRDYSIGNLTKDESYEDVRANNFYFSKKEYFPLYNDDCLRCEAISICGGKCVWADDCSGGESKSFCILSKNILNSLLWKGSKPLKIYGEYSK